MNAELSRTQAMQRMAEFAAPIRNLAQQNALIRRIVECYAHGDIITREEALCRMVVELARDWEKSRKDYEAIMLNSVLPTQPR